MTRAQTTMRKSLAAFAVALAAVSGARAQEAAQYAFDIPPWFASTFLDFREDIDDATRDGRRPCVQCLTCDLFPCKIGAKNAWAFDLSGACSGFVYALATGAQFVASGVHRKVLVIGADVMTSIIDFQDRATCVLFGDGAGAVLVEPADEGEHGIIDFILRSDGGGGHYLYMPAGGSLNPASTETVAKKMHYVHQDGKNVFKYAVRGMAEISEQIMTRHGLSPSDLKLYIPHQANLRIIKAAVDKMGLHESQVAVNIDRYANTTAGTIPICLSEAVESKKIEPKDLILLASFGAGFTWGSLLLRWEN